MPTLYSCGVQYSDHPADETRHLDYSCPDCPNESDEDEVDPDDYYDESGPVSLHAAERTAMAAMALSLDPAPSMYCPNISREISCEWEASAGVQTANHALTVLQSRSGSHLSSFEFHEDGTCDGEIVFSRLKLWERDVARAYRLQLHVLESLRNDGEARLTFAAGHHVHVSARNASQRGLTPNNLVSLYSVFAHCEDLLYRFAAAGWSAHRSDRDGSYSSPMLKVGSGQRRTPRSVGRAIGNERYQGLNVTPYLGHIQRCGCGAYRFGEWDACECGDHGATVEWRLWNGAISPRKIRAYIAISAVLTDYASQVDDREVSDLPEFPYLGTGNVNEGELETQLDYLLTVPGFSARDRDDIRWLASISPGMGSLASDYEQSRENVRSYDPSPLLA